MCRSRHPRPLPRWPICPGTFGPDGTRSFSGLPTARHLADDLAVFFAPAITPWPVRRRDALHSRRRRAAVHLITARRTDLLLLTSAKRITKERDAGAMPSTAPEFVAVVPESTPRLVVTRVRGPLRVMPSVLRSMVTHVGTT